MLKVHELLLWGKQELKEIGDRQAETEAELLIEHLLGCRKNELQLRAEEEVPEVQRLRFQAWVEQRKQRIPLAYILGRAYFWDEELEVGPGCLVPRPETETLVESVIRETGFLPGQKFSFLDIGTGSGAIVVALLRHFPNSRATALDKSEAALEFARRNAARYGLESRTEFSVSDLWNAVESSRTWDAVVSNPPYLSAADLAGMEPELRYEPRAALDGGQDGLDYYRSIIGGAPAHLRAGGWLALEMGMGQSQAVDSLVRDSGKFFDPKIICDYLNIERVIIAQRK